MPKISPRKEVTEHPLYRSAMAAQHLAYQLMREVPPEHKAAATRLHASLVHATTYAAYAVDPDVTEKDAQWAGLAGTAARAKEQLEPLAQFASDARDVEKLSERISELSLAADKGVTLPSSSPR
ncbi:MAG TPA: hypothetical protein VLJ18_07770 [Thermoanaerobaculia bacterium]|nr:hypothetical protein [Thermoanaerobaculia bacterium]